MKPTSFRACMKMATCRTELLAVGLPRIPINGISGCWLRDPQLECPLAEANPDQEARDRPVAHDAPITIRIQHSAGSTLSALAAALVRREGLYNSVSQPAMAGSGHGSSVGGRAVRFA